jgi:hypothetical protein
LARKLRQLDEVYTHVLTVKDDIMLLLVSRAIFEMGGWLSHFHIVVKKDVPPYTLQGCQ